MEKTFNQSVAENKISANQKPYNLEVIGKYLNFLGGGADRRFAFAFFDKKSERMLGNGLHTVHSNQEELFSLLESLNTKDFTLHVCLNEALTIGRKISDIIAPRVLCVDIDRWIPYSDLLKMCAEFFPHAVVETSLKDPTQVVGDGLGKYHLYWKLDSGISLQMWSNFQLGLSEIFQSDSHLAELNKTIRCPGVERVQKDGQTYTPLLYVREEYTPLTIEGVHELFPAMTFSSRLAKKKMREASRIEDKYFDAVFTLVERQIGPTAVPEKEFVTLIDRIGRNQTLFNLCKKYLESQIEVHRHFFDLEAEEILIQDLIKWAKRINDDFNSVGKSMLDKEEFKKTVNSAISRTLPYVKRQIEKKLKKSSELEF